MMARMDQEISISEAEKAVCRTRVTASLDELKHAIQDYKRKVGEAPLFILEKPAPLLPTDALKNVRVYPQRADLMMDLPANSKVAELGTEQGNWAYQILVKNQPGELHLFDLSFSQLRKELVGHKAITLHEGDSSEKLAKLPDAYFDWIYIDGSHTYRGVARDIEQAVKKVKTDGWLVFNDYTVWSSKSAIPYGVVTAVNELIMTGWDMKALALNPTGYWDVAIQRKQA